METTRRLAGLHRRGPLLAILLGIALIPFRESTTASNLTFAFVVLTIVVAEFGGRTAALATPWRRP